VRFRAGWGSKEAAASSLRPSWGSGTGRWSGSSFASLASINRQALLTVCSRSPLRRLAREVVQRPAPTRTAATTAATQPLSVSAQFHVAPYHSGNRADPGLADVLLCHRPFIGQHPTTRVSSPKRPRLAAGCSSHLRTTSPVALSPSLVCSLHCGSRRHRTAVGAGGISPPQERLPQRETGHTAVVDS